MSRTDRIYGRDEVEDLIAGGSVVVILNNGVYKLDSWLSFHPGGDKAIRHMVGRDGTDEVNALHSPEAKLRMKNFRIGRIQGTWKNFLPPIQGGHFRSLDVTRAERLGDIAVTEADESSDSSSESTTGSIVFDDITDSSSHMKHRRARRYSQGSHSGSTTSLSSFEAEEVASNEPSFLDVRTQKEIDLDLAKYPSLEPQVQEDIVRKYRLLNERLKAEGLYQCNYGMYAIEIARYTLLASLALLLLRWGWYATSAAVLGLFWHQLVFTAHDAGHMGITHNYVIDTAIGIVVADFIGGLSLGWWKWSHNVHHIVTNSPEHDPDIGQLPFFAISHRFFSSLRSSFYDRVLDFDAFAAVAVRYQHYLYYPLLTLGRFNLYVLSWDYLLLRGTRKGLAAKFRYLEIAGQLFFWVWFGYLVLWRSIPTWTSRVVFVLISHMITAPLHVQITLSHFAMSTADLGVAESFPQRMLRTTMDVDCPAWLDFIHGGLQFQAIHHLFPRMPRHNLRRAQKLVQEFCTDVGIPYALYGFVDGNKKVIGHLGDVGRQATILAQCQKVVAAKPFDLH